MSKVKLIFNEKQERIVQVDLESIMDLDDIYSFAKTAKDKDCKVTKIQFKTPTELFEIPCEFV